MAHRKLPIRCCYVTLIRMHEDRARVVAAVAAGRSYRDVAREYGISPPTAVHWFRAANADEKQLMSDAVQAVKAGHPIEIVARAARVPREVVWCWVRSALLPARRRTRARARVTDDA